MNPKDKETDTYMQILGNLEENLMFVRQRQSEFVLPTDIPLQLLREEKKIEEKINEIKMLLNIGQVKEINEEKNNSLLDKKSLEEGLWIYLRNLINKFENWNDLYTPLMIETNHSENISKELNLPIRFSTDKSTTIDIFKAFESHNNFIIVGDPGSGKTTSLEFLALIFARNAFKSPGFEQSKIPVLIKLNLFDGNINALIKKHFKDFGYEIDDNILKYLLNGHLVFLMDGLNEISILLYKSALSIIRSFYTQNLANKFIFTSREYNYNDELSIPILKVLELDKNSIISYVDKYIKLFKVSDINGTTFFNLLDNKLLEIAHNPLMLLMLLKVYIKNKVIPSNRGLLYNKFILQIFDEWENIDGKKERGAVFKSEVKMKVLSKIAFDMIKDNNKVSTSKANVISSISSSTDQNSDMLLDELLVNRIVILSDGILTYPHQSFQEFFAAKHLEQLYIEKQDISFAYDTFGWEEPVIFLSGLLGDSSDIIFDGIIDKNLYLAGEAIMSSQFVDEKIKIAVLQILYEKLDDPLERTKEASLSLIKKIDADGKIYDKVCEIGRGLSENELLEGLDSENWFIKLSALIGLAKMDSKRAAPKLIMMLNNVNEKPVIRWRISNAFRQIQKDSKIIENLIDLCKNPDDRIRWPALHALGTTDYAYKYDEKSIYKIQNLLEWIIENAESKNVRYGAVRVLGEICSENGTSLICKSLLNDISNEVRERAAAALGKIGDPTCSDFLLKAFGDSDWRVRREAIRSYGNLKFISSEKQEFPKQLLSALEDTNWKVIQAAIETIGKLKIKGSRDILMQYAKSANASLNEAVSKAILSL